MSQPDRLRSLCFRSVFAAGSCLALVFLMALSGAASITLLYDDRTFMAGTTGFEAGVANTVIAMRGLIGFLHGFGGYAAFILAGWAGVEMYSLSRALRKAALPEQRQAANRILFLGTVGSALLACSIGILAVTGVKAAGLNRAGAEPDAMSARVPGADRFVAPEGDEMVNWHTRELTYMLGASALLVAAATSQVRKVRQAGKAAEETATA
jgi:hypothetical protein